MSAAAEDEWLVDWVESAVADGWSLRPTYNEPVEHAGTLTRPAADDECAGAHERTTWVVMYLNRPPGPTKHGNRLRRDIAIHAWGPDRLAVKAPRPYSMEAMRAALRTCLDCGLADVDVVRIGFAGRTCRACHAKNVALVEYPGWTE